MAEVSLPDVKFPPESKLYDKRLRVADTPGWHTAMHTKIQLIYMNSKSESSLYKFVNHLK